MKIFEGYSGKALAVTDYLESVNDGVKTLIIDREGLQLSKVIDFRKLSAEVYAIVFTDESLLDDIINTLREEKELNSFKRVIFYLNVKKDEISKFKVLEKELDFELILTVQTHADESQNPIKVYEV